MRTDKPLAGTRAVLAPAGLSLAVCLVLVFGVAEAGIAQSNSSAGVVGTAQNAASDYWSDLHSELANGQPDPESGRTQAILGVPVTKDPSGLRRDTVYFVSYQVLSLGLLYMAPSSVSNWTPEDKKNVSFDKWWNNVTDPKWDSDKWWINYALHPYWGAAYFVRARMRGYDSSESFLYSFALSTMYEFGVEAIFEEPSIQDIFVTPALGSLLGGAFMNIRESIYAKQYTEEGISRWDRFVLGATDPLGWLNSKFDRLFGYDTRLNVMPFRGHLMQAGSRFDNSGRRIPAGPDDQVYGIRFSLRF